MDVCHQWRKITVIGQLVGGIVKLLMPIVVALAVIGGAGFAIVKGAWAIIYLWVSLWT